MVFLSPQNTQRVPRARRADLPSELRDLRLGYSRRVAPAGDTVRRIVSSSRAPPQPPRGAVAELPSRRHLRRVLRALRWPYQESRESGATPPRVAGGASGAYRGDESSELACRNTRHRARELSDEVLKLLSVAIAGSRCGRQRDVERCHSSQFTSMLAVGKRRRSMHGGAIVPDYQISLSPHVTVDKLWLSRMFDELA